MSSEISDLKARIAKLEARSRIQPTGPVAVPPPTTIDVHNTSGVDMEMGDWVELAGRATSGQPLVRRPTADGSASVLGVCAQRIKTGEAGKVHTHGLVIARVVSTEAPTAGDRVGTQSASFIASSSQSDGGVFYAWIHQAEGIAWVLLQRTEAELITDHRHDQIGGETSTPVYEPQTVGARRQGELHDLWKILETENAGERLANSIRFYGQHLEGWVWGNVLDEYGGGANGLAGWGKFFDIAGIEGEGETKVNLWTEARWNNGVGSVGPIWFAEVPRFVAGEGIWTTGAMIYTGQAWQPAIKTDPIRREECVPASPQMSTGDSDCNCIDNPQEYQLQLMQPVTGPYRGADSLDNYLAVICCLVERVNLLFRLVHIMDRCYGNRWQAFDNWMTIGFTSTPGPAPGITYPDVIQCLVAQVQALTGVNCGTVPDWVSLCTDVPYEEQYYKDRTDCGEHIRGE
uniref:Uncharacterized protein n=1 Tax=viral metagenome TaxID=1070528 RepID=A0A6M3IJA5_9ZZZZ